MNHFTDSLKYIPSQVIPAVAGFFAISLYTRLLAPEAYGRYILILTSVNLASALLFSWINQAGVRFYQEYGKKGQKAAIVSTGIISTLGILLVLVLAGTPLIMTLGDTRLHGALLLGAALFCTISLYNLLLVFLRADGRSARFGFYASAYSVLGIGLAYCLMEFLGLGYRGILLSSLVIAAVLSLVETASLIYKGELGFSSFSPAALKQCWKYGAPMVGVTVGALVLSVSDRYMIEFFLGTDAVGIYAAGYAISERSIRGITAILMLSALPLVFKTHARYGDTRARALIREMLGLFFIIVLPALCGLIFLAPLVVRIMLDDLFLSAGQVVKWVGAGIFFHTLGLYFNMAFQLKNRTRRLFFSYAAAAGLNILFNLFMIPRFGAIGAAWATCLSYAVYAGGVWLDGARFLKITIPWQVIGNVSVSTGLMLGALQLIKRFDLPDAALLFTSVPAGFLIYLAALFLLNGKKLTVPPLPAETDLT